MFAGAIYGATYLGQASAAAPSVSPDPTPYETTHHLDGRRQYSTDGRTAHNLDARRTYRRRP
jgi:hypothetical protein